MRSPSGMRTRSSIWRARIVASRLPAPSWYIGTSISCAPTVIEGFERGHRLLIDHRDPSAANPPQFLGAHGREVAPLKQNLTADHAPGPAEVAHDGKRDGRFAATGLPTSPCASPRITARLKSTTAGTSPARVAYARDKIAALENGDFAHDASQSRRLISRSPSAIKLKPRIRLDTDSAGTISM